DEPEDTPLAIDAEADVLGSIYRVPDAMWGFWAPCRDWHPGVCVFVHPGTRRVTMVKGTSQVDRLLARGPAVVIDPTPGNGLEVPTAFNLLEVRQYRLRRVTLLHREGATGRVARALRARLQAYLRRVCAVGAPAPLPGDVPPELEPSKMA